jgi:hypothetical protein
MFERQSLHAIEFSASREKSKARLGDRFKQLKRLRPPIAQRLQRVLVAFTIPQYRQCLGELPARWAAQCNCRKEVKRSVRNQTVKCDNG